jgi:hypothetical protein
MPQKSSFSALAICILSTVLAQAAPVRDIIPAGTILQCTIDEPNFSSKTAMVGDPLLCHLSSLSSFGHSAFPRGAMLSGHLEDYKHPGHFFGKGWLQLEFDRIVLPGDQVLPLSAKIISAPHMKVDKQGEIHGKGHPKRDAVEWMIPILWPIKIITLPARGPYPTFKGETRIALRLMEDIEVPFPVARNTVPMPPWATPSSYPSYGYSGSLQAPASVTESVTAQPATYTQRPEPSLSAAPKPLTIIALKGGAAFLAQEYWIENGHMRCLSNNSEVKLFPLERIDIGQSIRLNQERNVDFVLRSRDAVQ